MSTGVRIAVEAPAKINLYLKITGRRPDGYHLLRTLMQKVDLVDRICLSRIPSGIRLSCPDSELPEDEGNLAYRAARLFFETMAGRFSGRMPGVEIILYKTIPVAAGLGGGSSDAAAVLRGLDELFSCNCTTRELLDMGALLGADVPLFVLDWPIAWATGIGEQLQPAMPLIGYTILLANPGFAVSTQSIFNKFALTAEENIFNLNNLQKGGSFSGGDHPFRHRPIRPDELENDLERVTANQYAEIGRLKERMLENGALAALMSGSGPSVFGIFSENRSDEAMACCLELKGEYPKTFLVAPLQD